MRAARGPHSSAQESRLDYCKKRCSALIRVGRLGDAVSMLRGHLAGDSIVTPLGGATPTMQEAFTKLHPPANDDDIMFRYPSMTTLPVGLRLETEHVMREFANFPKLSAGGMSCWTLDLMSQVAGDDITVAAAFTNVYNLILSGHGGDASLWTLCRLIFLIKPDGKPRPIAMTDCFPRGLGRIVAAAMAKKLGIELTPDQVGVGIKGGGELVAHAISLLKDIIATRRHANDWAFEEAERLLDLVDPYCLLAIDFVNAFNCIRRGRIWEQILITAPELARYFEWAYKGSADLFYSDGSKAGVSSTGVRQGDPLGPLLFCLGIMALLSKLRTGNPDCTAIAFIDDVSCFGRRSKLERYLAQCVKEAQPYGLVVSTAKTVILDLSHEPPPGVSSSIERGVLFVTEGVKILGNPISGRFGSATGSLSFTQNYVQKEVQDCERILTLAASILPANQAFILCSFCISARMTYLARVVGPWQVADSYMLFDTVVDSFLAKILDVQGPLPALPSALRRLSIKCGGAGIRSLVDSSQCAYSASFMAAIPGIRSYMPKLWDLAMAISDETLERHRHLLRKVVPYFHDFGPLGVICMRPLSEVEKAEKRHAEAQALGRTITRGVSGAAKKAKAAQDAARAKAGVGSPDHTPSMIETLMLSGYLRARTNGVERDELVTHANQAGGAPKGFAHKDSFIAYQWWVGEVAAFSARQATRGLLSTPNALASFIAERNAATFGRPDIDDELVHHEDHIWAQHELQTVHDDLHLTVALGHIPKDSGIRAFLLSGSFQGSAPFLSLSGRGGGFAHLSEAD